jgi:murein DD-endopeptidase MepM/ murein hydrolase activator NlpD
VIYQVKVENGDTLASLAGRFDTSWQRIARMNGLNGKNPLRVGQVLRIAAGPGGEGFQVGSLDEQVSPGGGRRSPGRVVSKGRGQVPVRDERPIEEPAGNPSSEDDKVWQEEDLNAPRKTPGARDDDDVRPSRSSSIRGNLMGDPAENFVIRWPARGEVSSVWGPRWGRFHNGIDIRAPKGSPISSAAEGRVIFVGRLNGYGKTVIVDHGQYRSLYGHCGKIVAKQGSWVRAGALIAHVGISGNARGAHLHFELRTRRDQPVDPIPFMEAKLLSSNSRKVKRKSSTRSSGVRTAASH